MLRCGEKRRLNFGFWPKNWSQFRWRPFFFLETTCFWVKKTFEIPSFPRHFVSIFGHTVWNWFKNNENSGQGRLHFSHSFKKAPPLFPNPGYAPDCRTWCLCELLKQFCLFRFFFVFGKELSCPPTIFKKKYSLAKLTKFIPHEILNIQPTINIAVASCSIAAATLRRKSKHLFGFFEFVSAPHRAVNDIKNVPKKQIRLEINLLRLIIFEWANYFK